MQIEIEEIQRLNVRPGEVLLVTVPLKTTAQEADYIRQAFAEQLPDVKVVIATADIGVRAVSQEQAIARAVAGATANPGRVVEVKE